MNDHEVTSRLRRRLMVGDARSLAGAGMGAFARARVDPDITNSLLACLFGVAAIVVGLPARAQGTGHHHGVAAGAAPPPFIASTAKPFAALMDDAMAVMDHGMRAAPMNGVPEHDFVTMMIPHHQGAVDMARALLLTTKDAGLRNLAQGIITEQQNEIRLMQAWLQSNAATRR